MSHCEFTTNFKKGETCLFDYHGIQLNVRNVSLSLELKFSKWRKMSHFEFMTNFKTGEVCQPDYHGIQFNVRNMSLCL